MINKRAILATALRGTGMLPFVSRVFSWSGLLVLNYHRIGVAGDSMHDHGLWSASAAAFAEQIRIFKSQVQVIDPQELPEALSSARGRFGIITFDDGYRDNYEVALPILEAQGVKAAFFIATGFIDQPSLPWWDEIAWMVRSGRRPVIQLPEWLSVPVCLDEPVREQAVRLLLRKFKTLPNEQTHDFLDAIAKATGCDRSSVAAADDAWMTWDMVRGLRDAGMTVGGHTVGHSVLANMEPEVQCSEIRECCQRLKAELGESPQWFSYPVGRLGTFNEVTKQCLRRAGIRYAASYYGGYRAFSDWDDLDIRRVAVEPELGPDWFRAIVSLPKWFSPLRSRQTPAISVEQAVP